jgi:hypothetical protein
MIVEHDVLNVGHDRTALVDMAKQAQMATLKPDLTVLADRECFSGKLIRECEWVGIVPLVPKPPTLGNRALGHFHKRDFAYNDVRDEFRCPAGKRAIYRMTVEEKGQSLHRYWSSACRRYQIKSKRTSGTFRRITRWEHEDVLERMQQRLNHAPQASRWRRRTVAQVFGTLKSSAGSTHLLTKTLPRGRTGIGLQVPAHKMKRAMRILGVQPLMQSMGA